NYIMGCKDAHVFNMDIPQFFRFKILIRMKLIFILLLFIVQANANLKSQTITLNYTNTPLEKVLADVKRQSGYSYIANSRLLKEAKKVTVNVSNAKLDEALRVMFRDQPLYAEVGNGMMYIKVGRA